MVLDPRRQIGRRIRQVRQHRHLTQQAVAAKIGCSYQLIQSYEHGEKLSLDRLAALAKVFGVKSEYLLTGIDAKEFVTPKIVGFYTRQPQISNRVEADAAVKAMCGLAPDAEIDLDTWHRQVHADDLPRVNFELAKCLDPRGDGMFNAEYTLIGLDGIERRIADLSRTIFDSAKRPVRRLGIMMDISRWIATESQEGISTVVELLRHTPLDVTAALLAASVAIVLVARDCCFDYEPYHLGLFLS
jgi:transcriptional regulator with XRE-family HTH domain